MKLTQEQSQQLSQQQLLGVRLLQMSGLELEHYVRELSQENPVIELNNPSGDAEAEPEDKLIMQMHWLEENDRQNLYYQRVDSAELDPLARASTAGGLDDTLVDIVACQLNRLHTPRPMTRLVLYLVNCLDENGYLRFSVEELASSAGVSADRVRSALDLLYTLEPAGIGAVDLTHCLQLQLQRMKDPGPALAIVQDHLYDLAHWRCRAIASALGIPVRQVEEAAQLIRSLDPCPGRNFQKQEPVQYVTPDVYITEQNGQFVATTASRAQNLFFISPYYQSLLTSCNDSEVRTYLKEKLHQAGNIRWAIQQRQSTLQQCAQVVARCQSDFFRGDATALHPLRMCDVAHELNLHESTVSRAVREKFLQCRLGIFPISYFFCSSASAEADENSISASGVSAMIRQLIQQEDPAHPLSDQQLCDCLAQKNCPVSRRTVAKYREEMNIPNSSGRRVRHN